MSRKVAWALAVYWILGMVLALAEVITLSLLYPAYPRELFVFSLAAYFLFPLLMWAIQKGITWFLLRLCFRRAS